jgi:transposase
VSTATETTKNLPNDTGALHALVLTLMAERDALTSECTALQQQNDRIRHLLLKLKRMQFGAKSERLPEDQLQLGLEALEQAIARNEAEGEKRDPQQRSAGQARRRASRGALPAHLPRIEVTLAPQDTACPCCQAKMIEIGEDRSERLDVIPAKFQVLVTRRPKFVCRSCAGKVVQMPAPPRLIEGGIPTEAMVAQVLVARYADHLPLYRQAQMFAREGVLIERSTLALWMGYAAAELAPVVARLREMILASARIFADETVVPVLDPSAFGRSPGGNMPHRRHVAAAAPRRGISGPLRAMTGRLAAARRRGWSTLMRRAAGISMLTRCSVALTAFCNAMAMPPTRPCPA